jgi:hypothetical protein
MQLKDHCQISKELIIQNYDGEHVLEEIWTSRRRRKDNTKMDINLELDPM